MRSAHERLEAALAARGGAGTQLRGGGWRDWASATFLGARHELTLAVPGTAVEAFADGIENAEFALPGYLLADIAIAGRRDEAGMAMLAIEALTIVAG